MRIYNSVYHAILFSLPASPLETGGIIGGSDGTITQYILDTGANNAHGYGMYAPDTAFLNRNIETWSKMGIAFYGIFHSHFPISTALSISDKRYISQIMVALFPQVTTLYFPIVIPHSHMSVYRACIDSSGVSIFRDEIEIINGGT